MKTMYHACYQGKPGGGSGCTGFFVPINVFRADMGMCVCGCVYYHLRIEGVYKKKVTT